MREMGEPKVEAELIFVCLPHRQKFSSAVAVLRGDWHLLRDYRSEVPAFDVRAYVRGDFDAREYL